MRLVHTSLGKKLALQRVDGSPESADRLPFGVLYELRGQNCTEKLIAAAIYTPVYESALHVGIGQEKRSPTVEALQDEEDRPKTIGDEGPLFGRIIGTRTGELTKGNIPVGIFANAVRKPRRHGESQGRYEIRKLDQLRSSHINQQHNIRWQVKSLPEQIERARNYHAAVSADILSRDARADEDFAMKVGNHVYTGKGAREDAGNALNAVIMSWRDDRTPQVRAYFKSFEILSRGSAHKDGEPDLFIRGKETYKANLNSDNPLGTISSIEHTLRGLDRRAEEEQHEIERQEKALADYRAQLGRPFEHEARLKDLLARQAQLNACLDLDKHEAQIVDEPREPDEETLSSAARRPARMASAGVRAVEPPAVI